MEEEKKATEANAATIAPQEEGKAGPSKTEAELKIEALEAEKAKILEEKENYKSAYLKETSKKSKQSSEHLEDESDEERMNRIAHQAIADSRLAQIAKEQDELLRGTLKENKELKLALKNKEGKTVTATASSTESAQVKDTSISEDQLNYFKSRGWTDKDIERYKKNLQKNGR